MRRPLTKPHSRTELPARFVRVGSFTTDPFSAGAHHFTVVDPLSDANSAMTARVVELAKQTRDRYKFNLWKGPGSAAHHFVLRRVRDTGS